MPRINIPRLPGVYFATALPSRPVGLPPLDVAAFVGFAKRGPCDLPVAVEDAAAFSAVFGGTVPLARRAGGRRINGYLAGSVAAFFANGGRRCHVVRVAGPQARPARFRIPGMVALTPAGSDARQASVEASSPGRWAAELCLAPQLEALALPPAQPLRADAVTWSLPMPAEILPEPGDVLRIRLTDGRVFLFSATTLADGGLRGVARRLLLPDGPDRPAPSVALRQLTADGSVPLAANVLSLSAGSSGWTLEIAGSDATLPVKGDLLTLQLGAPGRLGTLIFPVAEKLPDAGRASALLSAEVLLDPAVVALPAGLVPQYVQRLRLNLHVDTGQGVTGPDTRAGAELPGLAFDAAGDRFWGDLTLAASSPGASPAAWSSDALDAARDAAQAFRTWYSDADTDARLPPPSRAALTGLLAPVPTALRGLQYLPIGVPEIPDAGFAPQERGDDGLDEFDPYCFVDPALVPNLAVQLPGESLRRAAGERHQSRGLRLRGMHALMFVGEVALVALPDATHGDWAPATAETPPPKPPPAPPPPVHAKFAPCDPVVVSLLAPSSPPPPTTPDLPLMQDTANVLLPQLHGAMLRFCHARRDTVALLSLPEDTEVPAALAWETALRTELARDGFGDGFDSDGLSYGAVWHPWLLAADDVRLPPEGAIAGLIARRERGRGAWIAPANEPLAGVIDLAPNFDDDDWATLFGRGINLVRRTARDFRPITAHSLSAERSLLQISVRRLLILLRKLALARGQELVFENNDARLHEAVRAMFDSVLTGLFERGAFAGRTPAESFHVLTGADVNTPAGIDRGEFVTRILVAPSEPMEFLVVQLSRAEDGALSAASA
jgi:hypothetical protein